MLFPLARSALGLTARGIQRTVARKAHHKHGPDFHDQYGNIILLSGTVFCVSVWTYDGEISPLVHHLQDKFASEV